MSTSDSTSPSAPEPIKDLTPLQQNVLRSLPANPRRLRQVLYQSQGFGYTQQTGAARHANIVRALNRLKELGLALSVGQTWYRTNLGAEALEALQHEPPT